MDKENLRPVKRRKGVLVLELNFVENFHEERLELLVSIPGRDGVVVLEWGMKGGTLPSETWFDVNLKLMELLSGAMNTAAAAQDVLPL